MEAAVDSADRNEQEGKMIRYCRQFRRGAAALAAAALFSGSAIAADIPKSPEVEQTGMLTIANTLDYAPFEFIDADGKQTGIIIELAQASADLMGVKLNVIRSPFPPMIPGLVADRFKIAWEIYAPTEERLTQVDFVTFIKSGLVASTTPDKVASFTGDPNLCGKALGISAGSTSEILADRINAICKEKGMPELTKSIFNTTNDISQAVLSGRIDALIDDATVSSYYEKTSGGKLVVVPGIYDVVPEGMAIKKGDTATANMMLAVLKELVKNGTYNAILSKYGMEKYGIDPYLVDSMSAIKTE